MRIGITGTPATGKTTLARLLSQALKHELVDVKKLVKKHNLGNEVDLNKLRKVLLPLPKDVVIESHLIAEIKLPLDVMVVLHASPRALKRRMKKRKYGPRKIKENIEAELLDYFTIYAEQNYPRVIHIDTTGLTPRQLLKKTLRYLKEGKSDVINHEKALLEYALHNKI
ncbi:MAG: AAA family ATPase [Candidatus Micrarchaeota archaeon]|nr:AAA family ATPase [Candidatus Micrarchaeota archaeon]